MSETPARRSSAAWIDDPALPQLLRLLRQEAGLSQRQLGEQAGLSPSAITRLESGERRPSTDVFERLAAAFGLPPSYLSELAGRLAADSDETALQEVREIIGSFRSSTDLASRYRRGSLDVPAEAAPIYESGGLLPAERSEIAATIPTGELRWVFRQSVGRDDRGFWIDPGARAHRGGLDEEDVRIHRHDDGTFVIDVSRLQHDIAPRDPERHVALAKLAGRPEESALADAYAATVLELDLPNGNRVTVVPTSDGSVEDDFPSDASQIHVVTAWNPRSRLLTEGENNERNRLLHRQLVATGATVTDALGRSSDGAWSEASFAVFDGDEDTIIDLAREFEQNAIFRWTPEDRQVVYCDTGEVMSSGWRVSSPASPTEG